MILAAVHGILTRQTIASWPDHLEVWLDQRCGVNVAMPRVRVLKKEYRAGPWPRLNYLKNRKMAKGLAAEFALEPAAEVWLLGHSNGAVVCLMTAKRLMAAGRRVGGIILTGAACEAEVTRNGVLEWMRKGMLGAAISYCSREDYVVDNGMHPEEMRPGVVHRVRDRFHRWLMWPYGSLGRTGWLWDGKPVVRDMKTALFTRWYSGGHSIYFAPGMRNCIFEQVLQDMREPRLLNGRGE